MGDDFWLFGYGSIIWKTGFDYESRTPAYIQNYARRFWQFSVDHRGTPEQPGRVVTLVPVDGEQCWGMAYRLRRDYLEDTLNALDIREVGGYERYPVPIQLHSGEVVDGLTYNAPPNNPHYAGESHIEDIAAEIQRSVGPSGSNTEYILELHRALEDAGVHDEHVRKLAQLVSTQGES